MPADELEAVREATDDEALRRCFPVFRQLRPHIADAESFLASVRAQAHEGYRIAYVERAGSVAACAGFRVMHMLHQADSGRVLYVDDLVTDETERSSGLGTRLVSWLVDEARRLDCDALELDSGVQRVAAHRFYLSAGFHIASYHFRLPLSGDRPSVLFQAARPEHPSRYTVRPMTRADIPQIVAYWSEASPDDLARMSVDPHKLPSPAALAAQFEALIAAPTPPAFYLMWLLDGRAIGYSALKNIQPGKRGEMHLHMWDAAARGQGHGAVLFCRSALDFYDRFRLQEVVCAPGATNPMPNRMLERIGFPLVRTYVGASSELSAVTTLNEYRIDRGVAAAYLARALPGAARGSGLGPGTAAARSTAAAPSPRGSSP